ncbi:NAD-dependent epimerase/dehydratase family protein [Microvirga pakistanensis]|uniref:NAD-dependent epimerase/dehydratase family protein n=1 Tax=Microvirga pakistanensis TaxID=1682650 RepID=UPI00106986AE|nr:SDR family oxidoreductase [Microvirga pakistanensis]
MRILITGNMGYVGPVLVRHLRMQRPEAWIAGYDTGYFGHCLTDASLLPECQANVQVFGDVRQIPRDALSGIDAVIQLAAISNDPMGSKFETPTNEINHLASVRLAEMARDAGVKRYIFASSCSMYGAAGDRPRLETDPLNPLTAYARSKLATEESLRTMDRGDMVVTALRFATACGMSPRLRLDLVLNDFVACALANGEITVLSDGTPWRPLIHVEDMARAIDWALERTSEAGDFLAVNAGSEAWNHQVRDLANAVADMIPGVRVTINADAPPDRRSYRVDFSLFRKLAPDHQPQVSLAAAIGGLKKGLERMNFKDGAFRNSSFMRLKVLEEHISAGRLSNDLYWRSGDNERLAHQAMPSIDAALAHVRPAREKLAL